ncbi:hypothetical protein ERJ75_000294100 [Trypanosoma vivax]|nr:hypothetical protein ERJ75_000294100 [Trypanosoma vivax]
MGGALRRETARDERETRTSGGRHGGAGTKRCKRSSRGQLRRHGEEFTAVSGPAEAAREHGQAEVLCGNCGKEWEELAASEQRPRSSSEHGKNVGTRCVREDGRKRFAVDILRVGAKRRKRTTEGSTQAGVQRRVRAAEKENLACALSLNDSETERQGQHQRGGVKEGKAGKTRWCDDAPRDSPAPRDIEHRDGER